MIIYIYLGIIYVLIFFEGNFIVFINLNIFYINYINMMINNFLYLLFGIGDVVFF